jgi:hypothetical protein
MTNDKEKDKHLTPASIILAAIIISGAWIYNSKIGTLGLSAAKTESDIKNEQRLPVTIEETVLNSSGVVLPVVWGDLGAKLVSAGAIGADKFKAIYEKGGSFSDEYRELLLGLDNGKLKITKDNAGYILNLLWALGLANKNPILESGEMMDSRYGGAQNFASTGGWTLADGGAMEHYSRHKFFDLTPEQQVLVDKVSKGIYRPCCGNSTHFPDCNHGMAMLGLLELMASQGVSEDDMWKAALTVNSYWFPDNYLTIATYMKNKGVDWKNVNPREVLGADYSSSQGYAKIALQVTEPKQQRNGSGCGVSSGNINLPYKATARLRQDII